MASTPDRATPLFFTHRYEWSTREDEILAGKRLPTIGDRRRGHSAFKGSPDLDAKQLAMLDIDSDVHTQATVALLKSVVEQPTADGLYAVYLSMGAAGDELDSYLWHAALRGHQQAVAAWCSDLMCARDRDRIGHLMGVSVALGMMSSLQVFDGGGNDQDGDDVDELRDHGMGILRKLSDTLVEYDLATDEIEGPQPDPGKAVRRNLDAALESMAADAEFLRLVEEDRAEIRTAAPAPEAPGHLVLGAFSTGDTKHKSEMSRAVSGIAGKRLPLAGADRVFAAGMRLHEDHPHLSDAVDRLLMPQVAREFPQLRALLVGPAGAGKSSLAMAAADVLGLPSMTFNAGGAADAAFGGTSSQYSSQRMALPMQLVVRAGIANPVVIVEEIDKVASGNQNGSLADVLLGFLEPSNARRYFDPALETTVDLSAVSYIMTANSLEDVPGPLRDRLQIIRVPEPTWEHVGALTARIIGDLAKERGLDPRWIPPFDPDELDVLKTGWSGGSLRQLTKLTRLMVDGREAFFGRA